MMRLRSSFYTRFVGHVLSYVLLMNVLVYAYLEYVVPLWGYQGYAADYSITRHVLANIGVFFLSLIIPTRISNLTSFILGLVGSSTLVTMLALYAARGCSSIYIGSLIIFMLIVRIIASRIRFRVPPRRSSVVPILTLSAGIYGACLAWIVARGGLSSMNFDLSNMYVVRKFAVERYSVGFFAYLLNWAQKIFGTTIFAVGLVWKSVYLISFALAGQMFLYATLSQKSPIAMLVLVLVAIVVARYRPLVSLVNLLSVLVIISAIGIYEQGAIEPFAIIVTRVFFEPAVSSILFFEFFSRHEFTFFSTSFLRGLVDYPYYLSVFDLISIVRTGEVRMVPNVGILATGYQQMGYFGLLFYAICAGIILAIFESLGKGMPRWVPLAVAAPSMYIMFTAADMSVALITNGGLIAMLVLFLWPTASAFSGELTGRPMRDASLAKR